jgi:hypothetical protein
MADEIKTDAAKVESELKQLEAAAPGEIAKIKAFWADYRFYVVAAVSLIVGLILGHKLL